MGMLITRIWFSAGLPAVKTVIARLEQLTAEKITHDEEGVFGVGVTSETAEGGFWLVATTETPAYEAWSEIEMHPNYLLDAVVVVLQALGGTYEYAALLQAAAQQPWQLAQAWYQIDRHRAPPQLPSSPN